MKQKKNETEEKAKANRSRMEAESETKSEIASNEHQQRMRREQLVVGDFLQRRWQKWCHPLPPHSFVASTPSFPPRNVISLLRSLSLVLSFSLFHCSESPSLSVVVAMVENNRGSGQCS
ncbi:uncharacterized protein DS421_19g651320 [Arachis hypogaea]|uniref:Uncharacterized protein n=1 Tax=Arachis hypogaea TaxID=3818 RepID=A0A6B9V796_ARAHY|nr:uncharacterized protein DS421_19g651320 [Arachis hypogaea]